MFSSIASYFFGSNTPATTTNSETNQNPTDLNKEQHVDNNISRIDAENTILISSLTPSVTGNNRNNNIGQHQQQQLGKRGKNKRNRNNKKQAQQQQQQQQQHQYTSPTLTKLLTPNEFFDNDLDEDEWFIVEKEDEEVSLPPQTDSEEELTIVEAKSKSALAVSSPVPVAAAGAAAERRQQHRQHQHISSHSLYSGPRPQQQRNLRSRNSGARHNNNNNNNTNNGGATTNQRSTFNPSLLSPPRSISAGVGNVDAVGLADGDMTRSLYVVASNDHEGNGGYSSSEYGYGANISMEGSWFVAPPPCFTSIGPINMETSPFENLLIEHPSMSVYRSIRSAQEATESFVNLDLGVEESHERRQEVVSPAPAAAAAENRRNNARTPRAHIDGLTATQLKMEFLARSNQKIHDKKQHETWCRGAMKRSNMVRDYQSKGNRQRRADRQHCKVVSGANNNRKSYF